MIDPALVVYFGLLALMLALAVHADFRRRARMARDQQEGDFTGMGGIPPKERAAKAPEQL